VAILETGQRVLGRFGFLLIALLFFLVTTPFAVDTPLAEARFRILFTAVLLAGVHAMSSRRNLLIAASLGAPALVGNWIGTLIQLELTQAFAYGLNALFLAYVAATVLAAVLSEREVTTDTVLGGICVYFLVGIGWSLLYSLLIEVEPTAILLFGEPVTDSIERGSSVLLYFSFVTMTTLGYGDVVPNSDSARMLASGEAVVGQLFIAILIARLVGLHISTNRPRP